jgi:ubiquinone/menaquinone biosynthesis C-methylase UbiE
MKTKTNMDYWKKVLDTMPQSYMKWFDAEEKYLQKYIKENSYVLEVGCGDGRSLEYVLLKTEKIFGIDIDPVAILPAKKRFVDNPFASIHLGDGRDLKYADNSFDYVMCMTTPANFGNDKDKFYSEMKRVLRENGEILSVFNEDALVERMKLYNSVGVKIKDTFGKGKLIFDESLGANVSEQFSREELEEIFERNGLKLIEIVKEGIGYFCRLRK